jgi:hypothetical protein
MSRIMGLVLAGGLIAGASSTANAQVAVSVGNPFIGRGVYVGAGAYPAPVYGGVGYGAPVVAAPIYPAYPTVAVGVGAIGYPAYRPYYGGYAYRPYGGYYGGYRRGYRRW